MRSQLTRLGSLPCREALPDVPAQRRPLLLIHGLGGGIWGWENFQNYFAAHGVASYALELPGHGREGVTARPVGKYSLETYALHVAAAQRDLGRCVVIGHSMGGLIAQKLAESQPQDGYVFLASAPPWHMFRSAYWPMWQRLLRHPWKEIVLPALGQPFLMDNALQDELVNNRIPAELREAIRQQDVPDSGRASMQMVIGLVSVDRACVHSPCLVSGGLHDRLIPPPEQRRLAAFYDCPLHMHDSGHMLMIEPGWENVAASVLQWQASLPRAA